jgi:hypothetical protein
MVQEQGVHQYSTAKIFMESDNNFYLYKTDTKNKIYRGSTTARFSDYQFTIADVAEIKNVQD